MIFVNIINHGATSIGSIGNMSGFSSKIPYQPTINCSEGQLPFSSTISQFMVLIQNPFDLGSRKISIDHQTCFLGENIRLTLSSKLLTYIGRPAILPHNSIINGNSCRSIPNNGGFSLIGNPNRVNLFYRDITLF